METIKRRVTSNAMILTAMFLVISCTARPDGTIFTPAEYREVLWFGERIDKVFWSPDGTRLATISDDLTGKSQIWESSTGGLLAELEDSHIYEVAWSPDGSRIASNTTNHAMHIWDTDTGEIVNDIPGLGPEFLLLMRAVAWSPDENRIASSADFDVLIWNLQTQQFEVVLEEPTDIVVSVAWSPDGDRLAVCGADGYVRIWNSTTWKNTLTVEGSRVVTWSPDGSSVTTAIGHDVLIWDAVTGERQNTLRGHTGNVYSISWRSDGMRLASVGTDNIVHIWDATTGNILTSIDGQDELAWSPTNGRLATVGGDGIVHIWEQ